MTFKTFLQILGGTAIVLTLLPFLAADYWWIRIFDFPHLQLTVFTAIATLAYVMRFDIKWLKDYVFMGLMIACLIFQISKIYPYLGIASYEVLPAQSKNRQARISVFVSNVLQKNKSYSRLLEEVKSKNPDLILLLEADDNWFGAVNPIFKKDYPYSKTKPLSNTYGMLLYSKLPLDQPEVNFLVDDSIPSIETRVTLKSGDQIQVFAIHPTPPLPQHNPLSTDRDAEMMKTAFKSRQSKLPVLVIGDFNDVAWSQTSRLFKEVSELLDPRLGRGLFNTFDANNRLLRWPLDHIFVSEHFRIVDLQRGNDVGSDHFPAYAKLSLEPNKKSEQMAKLPKIDQINRASNIIKKEATQRDTRKTSR